MTSHVDRRNFIRWTAAASLAPGVLLAKAKSTSTIPPPLREEYMLQQNGYAVNAETPLELLTDYLTPNSIFFVRTHWIPRMPQLATWKLTVDGAVSHPLRLTLAVPGVTGREIFGRSGDLTQRHARTGGARSLHRRIPEVK